MRNGTIIKISVFLVKFQALKNKCKYEEEISLGKTLLNQHSTLKAKTYVLRSIVKCFAALHRIDNEVDKILRNIVESFSPNNFHDVDGWFARDAHGAYLLHQENSRIKAPRVLIKLHGLFLKSSNQNLDGDDTEKELQLKFFCPEVCMELPFVYI